MKCNTVIEIDNNTLNNAIQGAVSNALKKSDIQNKLYSYGTNRIRDYVNQSYRDGRLIQSVAKEMSKSVPVNDILNLIDIEELKTAIIDKVSMELYKDMKRALEVK